MARLRVLSGREDCCILSAHGFFEIRRRGSHIVMRRQDDSRTFTIPAPNHRELRVGTLLSIIRQSGVPRSEFEESS
ncbi:MAG: type II toxin-antitoxin system HicA family toxin [Gammaproteobacteria bacterium]|nr:type II toxin-antitoxin system HicA family toxin [Gammaproteobacteria bacterium]